MRDSIGEVTLHLALGLGVLLRPALTLGLLSRSLFQRPFSFSDPLQSRLPARLLRQEKLRSFALRHWRDSIRGTPSSLMTVETRWDEKLDPRSRIALS